MTANEFEMMLKRDRERLDNYRKSKPDSYWEERAEKYRKVAEEVNNNIPNILKRLAGK